VSWVSIRSPSQQVSKGGSVKGYVNYVSMPEYGLDFQSRHSKSYVVNDGALSTEVLRVAIGYRSTRSRLSQVPFVWLEVKNDLRTAPTGEARVETHK
jgi:hypothetical protein